HAELPDLPGFFIPFPERLEPAHRRDERIWNGGEPGSDEHPAVVALAMPWGESLFVFCSGSLITPEWVLTAAHCIDSPRETIVIFGGNLVKGEIFDMIPASQLVPQPNYDSGAFLNDIGLVKLSEKKTDVAPVVLNDEPITD